MSIITGWKKFQKKKKNGEFWTHHEGNAWMHVEKYKRSLTEKSMIHKNQ